MKLMELFSPAEKDQQTDDIDWLGDLKFYIDNDDSMLEQHIFPAMKRHKNHVGESGVHKIYIAPIKKCLEAYCEEYDIQEPETKFTDDAISELAKHFAQIQEQFINRGDYERSRFNEDESNHVTFCFGRMNPPTIGHKQLLDTMASIGGEYKIFVSKTQDKKKNPLDYETKIHFIKSMFPEHASHVVDDASLNVIPKVATWLFEQGYTDATFVAGSDRLEQMAAMLQAYNGVDGKAHGYYNFNSLNFKSSGEREDGAEGVAGISASNAREAAKAGDFDAFAESTGAGELADSLYQAVRAGLGIEEDAAGVGIITKQNTTVDVDKNTTKKNLRKYKL